jgi:peptidoglycan-N-acetylglucosamine deacetylase
VRDGADTQKLAIVTTSWDDGHPLDERVAEILDAYGIRGTFYVPLRYAQIPRMKTEQLRQLQRMGMEIGSHTLTHPQLTGLDRGQILHELTESKHKLEDMLGDAVTAFCYPEGKFNQTARSCVIEAGYQLARTTLAFHPEMGIDPFLMPVSFQFFPHSRTVHAKHALKESNLSGLVNWYRFWGLQRNLVYLAEAALDYIVQHGGMLHIWGHSWELEEYNLWDSFRAVVKLIAQRRNVLYLTNSQAVDLIGV